MTQTMDKQDRVKRQVLNDLRGDEGFKSNPYKDSHGIWTIGHGWNLETTPLSRLAAAFILTEQTEEVIDKAQSFTWYASLSDNRQCVIVNMIFNLGFDGFKGFKNMIAALEVGDFNRAACEMADSVWYRQVPNRAGRLILMMRTG